MGNPYNVTATEAPAHDALENDTRATFADIDASPTKAWIVEHRNEQQWKQHYLLAFGRRPKEELYVLAKDPDQIHNVAAEPEFAKVVSQLRKQLLDELKRVKDPRVTGDGSTFDKPPYATPVPRR